MRREIAFCLVLLAAGCSPSAVEEAVSATGEAEETPANSVDAMSEILANNPTDEAALVQRGNEYFQAGAVDQAIQDYTAALAVKDSAATQYNRAVAYTAKDDFAAAVADYTSAIKLNPNDSSPWFNRGVVLHKLGKTAEGIQDLTEAIKLEPRDANSPLNRGLLYLAIGLNDRALDDFNSALKINPNLLEGYINRGYAYHLRADYDRAIEDFTRTIAISPKGALAYSNRGNSHGKKGELDSALNDLDEALRLEFNDPQIYNNRGTIHGRAALTARRSRISRAPSSWLPISPRRFAIVAPLIISSATPRKPRKIMPPHCDSIRTRLRSYRSNIAQNDAPSN